MLTDAPAGTVNYDHTPAHGNVGCQSMNDLQFQMMNEPVESGASDSAPVTPWSRMVAEALNFEQATATPADNTFVQAPTPGSDFDFSLDPALANDQFFDGLDTDPIYDAVLDPGFGQASGCNSNVQSPHVPIVPARSNDNGIIFNFFGNQPMAIDNATVEVPAKKKQPKRAKGSSGNGVASKPNSKKQKTSQPKVSKAKVNKPESSKEKAKTSNFNAYDKYSTRAHKAGVKPKRRIRASNPNSRSPKRLKSPPACPTSRPAQSRCWSCTRTMGSAPPSCSASTPTATTTRRWRPSSSTAAAC